MWFIVQTQKRGRTFDLVVIFLIIFSIVTLSIDTLPNLSTRTKNILFYSEATITIAFTIEYALRVASARKKMRYVLSFYGVIDLIAILPFYLALGLDLRAIRVFRVFRIFRIFKLTRYSKAMTRLGKALALAKAEAIVFLFATLMIIYLSAAGIYYFEYNAQPDKFSSIFHSLWWAVATLTTVGYGDVYPITVGGKIFTFVILMCGLGIVAVPAGLIAASLSKVREDEKS